MPTIKENLLEAIKIIEAVPDEVIDLRSYVHPCGTHFCAAGVLAQHAFFVDQLPLPRGSISSRAHGIANAGAMWGSWPFGRLFSQRETQANSGGTYDEELLAQHGEMSDKQLALARLYYALKAENANN